MIYLMQTLGVIATVFSVLSFQMKTHKSMMVVQFGAAVFFGAQYYVSYFALYQKDALVGAILNSICALRCVVFSLDDHKFFASKLWLYFFCASVVAIGVITWKSWVSIFMILAIFFNMISFSQKNPQSTRKVILIASPLSLIYNVLLGVVGGSFALIPIASVINEILSSLSSVIGLIRYKKPLEEHNNSPEA